MAFLASGEGLRGLLKARFLRKILPILHIFQCDWKFLQVQERSYPLKKKRIAWQLRALAGRGFLECFLLAYWREIIHTLTK